MKKKFERIIPIINGLKESLSWIEQEENCSERFSEFIKEVTNCRKNFLEIVNEGGEDIKFERNVFYLISNFSDFLNGLLKTTSDLEKILNGNKDLISSFMEEEYSNLLKLKTDIGA